MVRAVWMVGRGEVRVPMNLMLSSMKERVQAVAILLLASLICLRHVRKLMWYAPLCDSENSRFTTTHRTRHAHDTHTHAHARHTRHTASDDGRQWAGNKGGGRTRLDEGLEALELLGALLLLILPQLVRAVERLGLTMHDVSVCRVVSCVCVCRVVSCRVCMCVCGVALP